MKKFISLFLCFILVFSLTACKSSKTETFKDNNNNYISSDIDENGNIISSNNSNNSNSSEGDKNSFEIYTSETTEQETSTDLIVHFIDCGNADSTFVELPDNKTMLIDAGNNNDGQDICSYIQNLGYTKIDYLIGTHPHEDHIGGLDDVINAFDIGNIYLPRIPSAYVPSTKTYETVLTAISNKNLSITSPVAGQKIVCEGITIVEFMNTIDNVFSENINDYSLVMKIEHGENTFMLCADAEEMTEKEILNKVDKFYLQCDVLRVGHHGSYTSTSDAWLSAVDPTYAYIPCGIGNEYEHPHDVILQKLTKKNITYYRADKDGTVIFTSDGTSLNIQTKMTGDFPLGDTNWSPSMIKAGS